MSPLDGMSDFLGALKGVAGNVAQVAATSLAGPLGGMLVGKVASALGCKPDEAAVTAAIQADPEAAKVKLQQLDLRAQEIAQAFQLSLTHIDSDDRRWAEVQKTHRTEVRSTDVFVRRARPFLIWVFGAVMGVGIIGTMVAVFTVSVETMTQVVALWGALSVPIATLAAAAGLYVVKRTAEKQADAGVPPRGMAALIDAIRGEKR